MSTTALSLTSQSRRTRKRLIESVGSVGKVERIGRVAEAVGTLVRVTGIKASIGELCELRNPDG